MEKVTYFSFFPLDRGGFFPRDEDLGVFPVLFPAGRARSGRLF
jgi:hypothetical protein